MPQTLRRAAVFVQQLLTRQYQKVFGQDLRDEQDSELGWLNAQFAKTPGNPPPSPRGRRPG